jgi:hypothetical protein
MRRAVLLEHVVQEAAVELEPAGTRASSAFAAVVVADHRPHRERALGEYRGGLVEALEVAMVGEVAAEHEHVGAVGRLADSLERCAEAAWLSSSGSSSGAKPIWMSVICAISIARPLAAVCHGSPANVHANPHRRAIRRGAAAAPSRG